MENNHIYIGGVDVLKSWEENVALLKDKDEKEPKYSAVVKKAQELIKNYLQLDNVSFLFGTGSSIHLGAEGIQSVPEAVKCAAYADEGTKELFVATIQNMQRSRLASIKGKNPDFAKGIVCQNNKGWTYTLDEDGIICNCKTKEENGQKVVDTIEEIDIPLESLLNYLIATRYLKEAENDTEEEKKYSALISAIKKAMFSLCNVDKGKTREKDQKRIDKKGFAEPFSKDKYFFHEKFLKSLLQRPLNLKRANIFTSNYDLAFEYAFDALGIQYIDGFTGFHHRIFKPETFDYDIFYPGSTTAGKVQRIEKVVRYFKLHGSISWVHTPRSANNIYGISEMPIKFIEKKGEDNDFDFGDLMIYPSAVKKSYTLDFPYSEMFRQFAACITQPQSVLVTIGYSFCDEHLNDLIYQALSLPSFTLIIVDFYGSEKNEEIKRLRDIKDPRIIIIEGNMYGDFLTFSTELMPNFIDSSSEDKVVDSLKKMLDK